MSTQNSSHTIGFDDKPEVDGEFVPDKLFRPIGFDDKPEMDGEFVPDKLFKPHRI